MTVRLARWLLRRELRRLERHLDGDYDDAVSRRIDAVVIALEAWR